MGEALAATERTLGLSDPVLAYNLARVADWSTQMPFVDLMKMSRPWIGHVEGRWGGQDVAVLEARGLLDEHGWPMSIPPDLDRIGTVFGWADQSLAADSRAGTYVLSHAGEGSLRLGLDAQLLEVSPGRVLFSTGGGQFTLDILSTDPHGTGDYVRDISIVRLDHQDFFEAGAVFNPDWLAVVEDARQVRFMDWMRTNDTRLADWADRPQVDDVTWARAGVPVEIMVRLANQIGADPWFTLPHSGTDAFTAEFAALVRDRLDSRLAAHVELSNETWNRAFPQHDDLAADYVPRAASAMRIWDHAFGEEAEARLVKVLAGQLVNTWATAQMLPEIDASGAGDVFDAFAVASYFGAPVVRDPDLRAELLSGLRDPGTDAAAWLHGRMLDPEQAGSVPDTAAALARQAALAEAQGLPLLAYEGGQHVHQTVPGGAVSGADRADRAEMDAFLADFVRSDHMAALYEQLWTAWQAHGDGPFMHYSDVSAPGPHGAWGARAALTDATPRSTFLDGSNASVGRWWQDDRAETGFGHGVHLAGDAGDNLLSGTAEEDFLAGKAGDDVLVGGRGDDAMHGGPGWDIARLAGPASAYRAEGQAGRHILTGPDGTDVLVSVEELRFDDGERALLTEGGMSLADDGEAGQMQDPGADETPMPGDAAADSFAFLLDDWCTRAQDLAAQGLSAQGLSTQDPGAPLPEISLRPLGEQNELVLRGRAIADGDMVLDFGTGLAMVVEGFMAVDWGSCDAPF